MNRLTRRLVVVAAVCAALAVAPAAAARGGLLELSVVSSPAQYVSGGDARIEVSVPDRIALGDVRVTVNGADVTSAFGPDPEGNHQLEGVVTGLALGESRVAAGEVKRDGTVRRHDELVLRNNPLQGPIFSGPHQVSSSARRRTTPPACGLPPILQSPTCETPTVVSFVYLPPTGTTWFPYDPAAPPPASSIAADDDDGRPDGADDRALGARRDQPVHVLDHGPLAVLPDLGDRPQGVEPQGALQLLRRRRDRALRRARPSGTDMRHLAGLQMGYAVLYSSGTRTNTHYNLQLGGETAIMLKDRFVSGVRRARVHRCRGCLRRRDPAVRLRAEPSRPDRRRRAAVLVSRHGHADDPRRRLRDARALGGLEGARRPDSRCGGRG